MSTPASTPPSSASNEANKDQLGIARAQGAEYGKALQAMAEDDGAVICRAGD